MPASAAFEKIASALPGTRTGEGVEEGFGLHLHADAAKASRQDLGIAVGAARDPAEAAAAVIGDVEGRDDREQHLRRADVAGRFFPTDMLFAGLERHAKGRSAGGIDGHADQTSGHGALVGFARCEEGGVRAAIAHGHAEALCAADGDVGAHLAGWCEHHHGQKIGRHDRERTRLFQACRYVREVPDFTAGARIAEECAEHLCRLKIGERITFDDLEAERFRPRLQYGQGLWVGVRVDEEALGLRLGDTFGHGHRFGCCGRFVEQRGVGEFEPGEVDDRLLEVQEHLEPALADLRLIGRVGCIPAGVFQNVAQDDRRRDRAVIAHADHRGLDLVGIGHGLQMGENLTLGHRFRQVERVLASDRGRRHFLDQVVE